MNLNLLRQSAEAEVSVNVIRSAGAMIGIIVETSTVLITPIIAVSSSVASILEGVRCLISSGEASCVVAVSAALGKIRAVASIIFGVECVGTTSSAQSCAEYRNTSAVPRRGADGRTEKSGTLAPSRRRHQTQIPTETRKSGFRQTSSNGDAVR